MDNLTLSAIIKNNIGLKNLEENSKSDGIWADITSLFTASSAAGYYIIEKDSLFGLIKNIPLRITIELLELPESLEERYISGTIQLYATVAASGGTRLLTNSIHKSDGSFKGILAIYVDSIIYDYGVDLSSGTVNPKILKVERLVV